MNKKYNELVSKLIIELGGANNITAATHCVSRLRLVLKDDSIVNDKNIENIDGVKGFFKVNGQVHIIIGQEVPEVYNEFMNLEGMSGKNATAASIKTFGNKKQSFMKRMMNHISEIFMPLIPILVAGGLILGLRNILETAWDGTHSAVSEVKFFAGLNAFLWIPACAVFWFMPVFIVWSIFKKMNGSQPIGILIGLSLLVSLPSMYDLTNALSNGREPGWWMISDFFTKPTKEFTFEGWGSYPIKVGYTSQVVPAIMVAFLGVYIERFLNKYVTPVIRQVVVPLVTVLSCFILAFLVIGPVGYVIGTTISIILSLAFTNYIAKYFVAPIFGLFYAPLVLTGLHHTLNAVMTQNTDTIGGSFIFPILAASNICQGAAALMYGIINIKDEKAKQVAFPATTSAWLAVTEPAMYGVNLKNSFCFISACIGSCVASTLITAAGVTSNGIGNGAWLGVLSIQPESKVAGVNTWIGTGYTWFIIACLAGTAITMVLTYLLSKTNIDILAKVKELFKKENNLNLNANNTNENVETNNIQKSIENNESKKVTKTNNVKSIGNGKVYSLDDVEDQVFKNKILGDGLAIDILDGKVYSPISGTVGVVADTRHAYGIVSDDGISTLIHIGVDTVKLEDPTIFKSLVKQGDKVKVGQLICEYNRDKIIDAKLDHRVMFLVTPDSTRNISTKFKNKNITKKDIAFNLEK